MKCKKEKRGNYIAYKIIDKKGKMIRFSMSDINFSIKSALDMYKNGGFLFN